MSAKLGQAKLAFKLASWNTGVPVVLSTDGARRTVRVDRRAAMCAEAPQALATGDRAISTLADARALIEAYGGVSSSGADAGPAMTADRSGTSAHMDFPVAYDVLDRSAHPVKADASRATAADRSERDMRANADG